MRYIEKGASPDFFEACKQSLPNNPSWNDFYQNQELGQCKKSLHDHLITEQSGLCIYCEKKIEHGISHVEHIYPKTKTDKFDYSHLTFDYMNLVASCNGESCSVGAKAIYKPEDVHSCGHKKKNDINEGLFLNPVTEHDISNYFTYDKTSCAIQPSNRDPAKASYTLDLLNLDNPRLSNERANARKALMQATAKFQVSERKQKMRLLLAGNPAFISFLRYHFSSILATQP